MVLIYIFFPYTTLFRSFSWLVGPIDGGILKKVTRRPSKRCFFLPKFPQLAIHPPPRKLTTMPFPRRSFWLRWLAGEIGRASCRERVLILEVVGRSEGDE